jgi:hypothetical protein
MFIDAGDRSMLGGGMGGAGGGAESSIIELGKKCKIQSTESVREGD